MENVFCKITCREVLRGKPLYKILQISFFVGFLCIGDRKFFMKSLFMLETSFEHTAVMSANKSTTITQYTTDKLHQRKNAIGETLTNKYV